MKINPKCKWKRNKSPFSNDGHALARHLRVVAEELNRSSDVLDGTVNDAINFFDEVNGRITNNYVGVNVKQGERKICDNHNLGRG